MAAEQPSPPRSAVNTAIAFTAAAGVAALSLSLLVLVLLLRDLHLAAYAVRAATAAVLGLLPAIYVAAHLGFRRAAPPVVPGAAAALRASAEALVAAACASLVNLLPGGPPATASGAEEATATLQASCVVAVFVVLTADVLLLLLSVSGPIPETVSRWGIHALKVAGVMLMAVSLPLTVAFVFEGPFQIK